MKLTDEFEIRKRENFMKKTLILIIYLSLSSLLIAGGNQRYVIKKLQDNENISLKNKKHSFIGYTTNIPNQFLGFSIFSTHPRNIGLYLDMKGPFGFRSESDDFYENISVNKAENIFGDSKISTDDDWLTMNIGITKVILNKMLLFIGAGYSDNTHYNQYYDEYEILGSNGKYWIERKSNSGVNFFGGSMFIVSDKIILQFGASSFPSSLILGIGYLMF